MMSLRTVALVLAALAASPAHAGPLQTAPVERTSGAAAYVAEGVVEAVRETTLAVEVQGRITDIRVQAGDRVKAGQVLARIDARLAGQQAAAGSRLIVPSRVQVLPLADPASHTAELRLEMDAVPVGVMPGMFARVRLASGGTQARLSVPARAVVHRTELDAVYVVDGAGRAILRQVRLGEVRQDRVEILSGVSEGEQIALDPVAAAASTGARTP